MTDAPKALVFDWDNTLVDSWAMIHAALTATFTAMDAIPWTMEETRARVRASARDTFPKLFGERADEAQNIFYESYERDHLSALKALPGAQELITAIAGGGLFLSILSNKKGTILRRELAHLGWAEYFSAAVGALDAARDKPAREALLAALDGSGVDPGPEVWVVGDTDIDMRCAADHGCEAVLVRPQPAGAGEFGRFEPLSWSPDCHDLLRQLRMNGLI